METVQSVPNAIITFPMFGKGFAITPPETYTVFGLTLHCYGTIIAIGFLLAYLYASKRSKQFGLTQDNLIDMLPVCRPRSRCRCETLLRDLQLFVV